MHTSNTHRSAARTAVWMLRADDDTPAGDMPQILDMLGLVGDDQPCERHGRAHPDVTPEPGWVSQQPPGAPCPSISDRKTEGWLTDDRIGPKRQGPELRGRYCPPGLRRVIEGGEPVGSAPIKPAEHRPPKPPAPKPPKPPKPKTERKPRPAAAPRSAQPRKPHKLPECGTEGGYRYHMRHGTEMCTPCRGARRAADRRRFIVRRDRAIQNGTYIPRPPARCGTVSGYKRHKRLQEDVCDLCRKAKRTANDRERGRSSDVAA